MRRFGFLAVLVPVLLGACEGGGEQTVMTAVPDLRRMTEAEYRNTISDLFGSDIKVAGRFDPDIRRAGLLAVGTTEVAVTRAGFERYDTLARSIAAQVMDETHRDKFVTCKPVAPRGPDDACAAQFIREVGTRVMRRPLNDSGVQALAAVARTEAQAARNFYAGLELVLAGLLVTPDFLFRIDTTEPNPAAPGTDRLDAYSKAQRLSYFLWNSMPDVELFAAAARGDLHTARGLTAQVDRMLASPRLETGVRAFFTDMLHFDALPSVEKDPALFPRFSRSVISDSEEQTLRTITHHLLTERGDYRDLFTTRATAMTRNLGVVYRVPVAAETGWQQFEFSEDDGRTGLLTQISFLAMNGPSGRSSPTLRGKAVREIFLCQKVPDPPGNVDFTPLEDATAPDRKTVRDRLLAHSINPACAGCHKIMDPLGLALESFDGLGQHRTRENGAAIDTSGVLDGVAFTDAAGLGEAMRNNSATVSCIVNNVASYALGRSPGRERQDWLAALQAGFAKDGHRLPALLRRIATSDTFYGISKPVNDLGVDGAVN